MTTHRRFRRALALAGALMLSAVTVAAAKSDCERLPASALRTRPCNPQAECLKGISNDTKGGELEARRKECGRLPTSGVCHGPESYNPQAECREPPRKK